MDDSLGRLLYSKQPEQNANTAFSYTDPVTSNTQDYEQIYTYDDLSRLKSAEEKIGAAERRPILAVGVSPRSTRRDSQAAERRQISTIRKFLDLDLLEKDQ